MAQVLAGDPREGRQARLRDALRSVGVDALLIASRANTRYLTGFSGSSSLLVVSHSDTLLITDFRYRAQAKAEAGAVAQVEIEGTSLWTRLWDVFPRLHGIERVGFESAHMVHADFERLADAGKRWSWRAMANAVEGLRLQKDEGELACIRAAVAIAERALEVTIPAMRAGRTELDVGAELEHQLRGLGSEAHPFETIVASGERSALPHARCTARELRAGDLLIVDFGAVSGGYCSDITRTFVVGRAGDDQREAYGIVLEANATASAAVRAGMRGRDADALARDCIERRGLGPEFGHSLGHGIGLEVHEAPRLARTIDAPLMERAVVTIEPGVYREGWGGVRIEDDVYLSPEGPVVLTTFPRELHELV